MAEIVLHVDQHERRVARINAVRQGGQKLARLPLWFRAATAVFRLAPRRFEPQRPLDAQVNEGIATQLGEMRDALRERGRHIPDKYERADCMRAQHQINVAREEDAVAVGHYPRFV